MRQVEGTVERTLSSDGFLGTSIWQDGRHPLTEFAGQRLGLQMQVHRLLVEGDMITRRLLHPQVPIELEDSLHAAFKRQAIVLGIPFGEVRVLTYYLYQSLLLMLSPLEDVERANIRERLISAFGVPQECFMENLAARLVVFLMLSVTTSEVA